MKDFDSPFNELKKAPGKKGLFKLITHFYLSDCRGEN